MGCFVHSGGGGAWAHGSNLSSAVVKVEYDGSVDLISGVPDIGQGATTILAMIVAEVIGIDVKEVRVHTGDTDITPVALGARGSRETFLSGNAAKLAAEEAKRELFSRAASMLEVPVEDLDSGEGEIFEKSRPERSISIGQAAG